MASDWKKNMTSKGTSFVYEDIGGCMIVGQVIAVFGGDPAAHEKCQ